MLHSGFTRTTIAAATVIALFAQVVMATPIGCQCSRAAAKEQSSSCCHAEPSTPSCCKQQSPCCKQQTRCCQCKRTQRCEGDGLSICQCGCNRHQDTHPVAIAESSKDSIATLKLAIGELPCPFDVVVATASCRLSKADMPASDRAPPSVQVLLCVWIA